MKVRPTSLAGVMLFEPALFADARGSFQECYHRDKYREAGIESDFVQDNHSCSEQGVLRGLHYQYPFPQGKLVWALKGEIFDVAVDMRQGSPTYGRWFGALLSDKNRLQMFVPAGFAHGFCVTSERAEVFYKCTDLYRKECEHVLRWDDPSLAIDWPVKQPLLSPRDAAGKSLDEVPCFPSTRSAESLR